MGEKLERRSVIDAKFSRNTIEEFEAASAQRKRTLLHQWRQDVKVGCHVWF